MKYYFLFFLPSLAFGASLPPAPFPVFLKAGFSSVLEFDETPSRVVLGDGQSFQVEKLERSLVIKTLAPYAASNMYVYFNSQEPRLFVLTASEDAEPTYYKKFESLIRPEPKLNHSTSPPGMMSRKDTRILHSQFDTKKDYLTIEIEIVAHSQEAIKPNWGLVRLKNGNTTMTPFKLWAERQEVQKDSQVKARFIFAKPNIPRDLKSISLIVPLLGNPHPISLPLRSIR